MFYSFSHTPSASDTAANPHIEEMQLTEGVIHQVDVMFQDGCDHEIFVQIFHGNHQLWPSNRGEKLRGNATIVSFREFYEMKVGKSLITAKIWTTLTSDFKEVIINIGVLPKEILQPMSFKELIKAATGQ